MAIQGINNNVVNQFDDQYQVNSASSVNNAPQTTAATTATAPPSVDVTVEISPQAQQLAQDNLRLQSVNQSNEGEAALDASSASQFGINAASNNATVAAEVTGRSSETLNATPSNSSQSGSVASQYNISPDTALGQTIDFSA